MSEAQRLGEGGTAPEAWFVKELKTIDPRLEVMWMPRFQRHAIVTPVPEALFGKRYNVEAICIGSDGSPLPLNGKLLLALRKARYERDNMRTLGEIIQEIDREEQDRIDKAEAERIDRFEQFSKKAHKLATSKTFT